MGGYIIMRRGEGEEGMDRGRWILKEMQTGIRGKVRGQTRQTKVKCLKWPKRVTSTQEAAVSISFRTCS